MEDNKEILTNNSEVAKEEKEYDLKTFEENTEPEASEDNNEDVTEESSCSNIENVCESATKKEPVLQKTIIISIAILLAFLASFLIVRCFFNTSIIGAWVLEIEDTASPDEATLGKKETFDNYYIFKDDGSIENLTGTVKYVYNFATESSEDGKDILTTGLFADIPVEYRIEGNEITGRTLTISYDGEDMFTFKSASPAKIKLETPKDYKENEKILGKWYDASGSTGDYYYNAYEFKSGGKCSINSARYDYNTGAIIPVKIEATYTFVEDKIRITYKMVDDQGQLQDVTDEYNFAYDEKNDVFVMDTLGFYRVNDDFSFVSTPDQLM